MNQTPTPFEVAQLPDILRFEVQPGEWIELDIVEAQLRLEMIVRETRSPDKTPEQLTFDMYERIKDYIRETRERELTTTQASMLFTAIRNAYAVFKKKFHNRLGLPTGMESLLPSNPPTSRSSSNENSQDSTPNENSLPDQPTPSTPQDEPTKSPSN